MYRPVTLETWMSGPAQSWVITPSRSAPTCPPPARRWIARGLIS